MSSISTMANLDIVGTVHAKLTGPDGSVKLDAVYKNLVVTSGKEYIAAKLHASVVGGVSDVSEMAIGSGTALPMSADLALQTELERVAFSVAPVRTGRTVTFTAIFLPTTGLGTRPITEAGIFNTDVTPRMLNRVVFPVVNKEDADTLEISWDITIN
jgi:hypothetical protein